MISRNSFSGPSSRPIAPKSSITTERSRIRSTTLSPNMVGSTETRKSTGWPPTVRRIRPSCGRRRSAMSRSAITLTRLVIANARCLGGGTISYSTPSPRIRILNSFSNGSKCRSLEWSLIASNSTMFSSLRTGALSAKASTLVRSRGPSFCSNRLAVSANSTSDSMSAISVSTLSPPTA